MLKKIRHEKIIEYVNTKGSGTIQELMSITNSSESTIRADLVELDKTKKIKRVHGGAFPLVHGITSFLLNESNFADKVNMEVSSKQKIASYASSLVKDNMVIYVDAGTTTYLLGDYITASNVTVITNSMKTAKKFINRGFQTIVTGGKYKVSTDSFVGTLAEEMLLKFHFSIGFFGTNGVAQKEGVSTPDYLEAQMKKAAIKNSIVSYVLCDHTKFEKVSPVSFASLEEVHIISDQENANYPCIIVAKKGE